MSTPDLTEYMRREMVDRINSNPSDRALLEERWGKDNVWDTHELMEHFEVKGFMAPYCLVIKKLTGEKGSVMFQHSPRLYFHWEPKH